MLGATLDWTPTTVAEAPVAKAGDMKSSSRVVRDARVRRTSDAVCMEGIGAMHDSTDAAAKAAAPRVAASQTSGEERRERRLTAQAKSCATFFRDRTNDAMS